MIEPCFRYRNSRHRFRPFQESAQVCCRGYSQPLERILVDFGSEDSFEKASERVQEHYGFEVPPSAVRKQCLKHADGMVQKFSFFSESSSDPRSEVEELILQSDGVMLPLVAIKEGKGEARKRRKLSWKEAIGTLVHPKGSRSPIYAATLEGREHAGLQMKQLAQESGMGAGTHIHAIGDGALWIQKQVEIHFGNQADYLIDFYHLCEYLHEAVQATSIGNKRSYLGRIKSAFKQGKGEQVMRWFKRFEEAEDCPAEEAPIRAALRYVKNRPGQFQYHKALENDLPIGSGEIESSHRHLIQKRLKIAGAWWKKDNAHRMLQLRTCRANKYWNAYWKAQEKGC